MTTQQITRRIAAMERELKKLKAAVGGRPKATPWWKDVAGSFADDPTFRQAAKLGRAYRLSQRRAAK